MTSLSKQAGTDYSNKVEVDSCDSSHANFRDVEAESIKILDSLDIIVYYPFRGESLPLGEDFSIFEEPTVDDFTARKQGVSLQSMSDFLHYRL